MSKMEVLVRQRTLSVPMLGSLNQIISVYGILSR